MIGTELIVLPPDRPQVEGTEAARLPTLRTTAETGLDLVEVWFKSHADP